MAQAFFLVWLHQRELLLIRQVKVVLNRVRLDNIKTKQVKKAVKYVLAVNFPVVEKAQTVQAVHNQPC